MSWIKIEETLPDKPEIDQLARILSIDHDAVVGKLIRLWIWADKNTIDGNAIGVTFAFLDRIAFCPGFAQALQNVGWITIDEDAVAFRNFDRHNGQTAKCRAETGRRVALHRAKNAGGGNGIVTDIPLHSALQKPLPDKIRVREDKEGEIPPTPQGGSDGEKTKKEKRKKPEPIDPSTLPYQTEEFIALWNSWEQYRTEIKKPITPTSRSQQFEKLKGYGEVRAIIALRESMANGWQGVFEPKGAGNGNRPPTPMGERKYIETKL